MAHDFAKTRTRKAPERSRPVPPPPQPAKGLLVTGLFTGLALGFFFSFLVYLSGVLPPVGNMIVTAPSGDDAEILATAQQKRTEELEQAAAKLQLEFYKELPNYEVIVENMPQSRPANTTAAAVATVTSALAPTNTAVTTAATTEQTVAVAAPIANEPLTSGPSFMIQAGAFQQETSATAQSQRLTTLGLEVRVKKEALLGKTLFLVQAGPYTSRDELNRVERLLRSNSIDSMRIGLSQ